MKTLHKLLISLLSFCLILLASMNAAAYAHLSIENIGSVNKVASNKLSQQVKVMFNVEGPWRLFVEPIGTEVSNLSTPNKSLPITRLDVSETSGVPLANLDIGRSFKVKEGNSLNGAVNLNLYVNALNFDGDYPGNYTADLRFKVLDNNNQVVDERVYTFRFEQAKISSLAFDRPDVHIEVAKDNALRKNYQQNLKYPFGVHIKSNKDWKLYLIGKQSDDKNIVNYFYRVSSVSDDSIQYPSAGEYAQMQDYKMLVAEGKSTLDENTRQLMEKVINMDYLVKGPSNNILPAGTIKEQFEYILETEEN